MLLTRFTCLVWLVATIAVKATGPVAAQELPLQFDELALSDTDTKTHRQLLAMQATVTCNRVASNIPGVEVLRHCTDFSNGFSLGCNYSNIWNTSAAQQRAACLTAAGVICDHVVLGYPHVSAVHVSGNVMGAPVVLRRCR